MAKKAKIPNGKRNAITVERKDREAEGKTIARVILDPCTRHAFTALPFIQGGMGKDVSMPGAMDFIEALTAITSKAESGNLTFSSRMLAAQAMTLDTMFGEFTRRSAANMGQHLDATERYARLALKAQANSRATLEALAKLHQPREQTVRHVHVNDGGQAIVADQVNHYAGRAGNSELVKQANAVGAQQAQEPD